MSTKLSNIDSPYPTLNLSDPLVVDAQMTNAVSFRAKWVNLMATIALMFCVLFAIKSLPTEWREIFYSWIAIFIVGCYFIYRMFRYTCPHCGERPMSVSIAADGSSFTYTKGVALFPRRCVKCGYYLSEFALMEDIEIQQMQSDRSSSLHSGSRPNPAV
jgi:hypothetical protein